MSDTSGDNAVPDWVSEQIEAIQRTGTTDGLDVLGVPIVLLTLTGAKSGEIRPTPVMRVKDGDSYAVVASKGGAPKHPTWYYNIKAHPEFPLQDGAVTKTYVAREASGDERTRWWDIAVQTFPSYAEYQQKTDRLIPLFVLDPK